VISVWRIDKKEHSASSFSGEGAFVCGGRWSPRGVRAVYAAQSLALAALEKFVHLQGAAGAMGFVSFRIDVPESVKVRHLDPAHLPRDWRGVPAPASTQAVGAAWARKGDSAILRVPSVLIPSEYDYLLNPLHADFKSLRISAPEPFHFDQRMWK
jgi:RES domain-containing protein